MTMIQSEQIGGLKFNFRRGQRSGLDLKRGVLRALVLLSGSMVPSRLIEKCGRSLLDLPVEPERSLMDLWRDEAAGLARQAGLDHLLVRVVLGGGALAPRFCPHGESVSVRVEHDPCELRGTGGVLRDLVVEYADDDWIVVANAAQLLLHPLAEVVADLAARGTEAATVSSRCGTPGTLFLIQCRCLRLISKVGFVDMKEQAFPMIAAHHRVSVKPCANPVGLPVRTVEQYVWALRRYHRQGETLSELGPFAEDWYSTFSMVEPGARVDGSAIVHDSVVLEGGEVQRGVVLVRSVVGPKGVARRETMVVDQMVG